MTQVRFTVTATASSAAKKLCVLCSVHCDRRDASYFRYAASIGAPLTKDSVYKVFISCVQVTKQE